MNVGTVLRYLTGNRGAVSEIASTPSAVLLGLLFVLSAGLAREYDRQDLMREPWHLFLPLVASLVTSLLLFLIVRAAAPLRKTAGSSAIKAYLAFLGLFWMTAPLAWLYAVPYERFLSEVNATWANLATLGVVSLWRVLLMTRVVSLLIGVRFIAAFFLVMLFADMVAVTALFFAPLPVISIMGGIEHTEAELVLSSTATMVGIYGVISFPLWLIGALVVVYGGRSARQLALPVMGVSKKISSQLWAVVGLSLVVWIPILPFTQGEQRLRSQVEQGLREGQIVEALALMSSHDRDDFPPHWDPPPRKGYGEHEPAMIWVMEAFQTQEPAPWVRELYKEKLGKKRLLSNSFWRLPSEEERLRFIQVLERLPERGRIAAEILDDEGHYGHSISNTERQLLETIVQHDRRIDGK